MDVPTVCFTDSKQLYDALKSSKTVLEKRLRVEVSSIQELLQNGEIGEVKWVQSELQLADSLTKKTANYDSLIKRMKSGRNRLLMMDKPTHCSINVYIRYICVSCLNKCVNIRTH